MTGQMSQDLAGSDESREQTNGGDFGNAGMGAASALERMKSEHDRRHRRQHGTRGLWPERDDGLDHVAEGPAHRTGSPAADQGNQS